MNPLRMRPLLFALLTLCFLQHAAGAPPRRLRVLTYNIHHAAGVDRRLDIERIAGVIRDARPDIVALQEVDQGVERTQGMDQPARLAELTDLQVVFGDNIAFGGGRYGNAVLSGVPITASRNHALPNHDGGEQRGVLEVTLGLAESDTPLMLYATHLDHRSDDRERFASAQAINRLVAEHPDRPAILAGDLNDTLGSRTLREFGKRWTLSGTEVLPTVPVGEPKRQIDFVLFRPAARWRVVEVSVLPEAVASDHRAVLAVLELTEQVPGHRIRQIEGWTVHISDRLFEAEPDATGKALDLLAVQLREITQVVPAEAVRELRRVPLWFSPEYPGVRPRAEYHPGAGWLRENNRNPAMEKAVEFTNVRIFEREVRRMPNFALHELAHAYHDRVLPGGFGNTEIRDAFEQARDAGLYDQVEQRFGDGRSATVRAYAITNPMEYFAESSEAYFSTNDFFPFTRKQLREHDPVMFKLLRTLWSRSGTDGTAQDQPPTK